MVFLSRFISLYSCENRSKTLTMTHLVPCNSHLAGFFAWSDAGFLGLGGVFAVGPVFQWHESLRSNIKIKYILGEGALAGTGPEALREGFLWVISLLSTFLNPLVISAPWLIWANTAAVPDDSGSTQQLERSSTKQEEGRTRCQWWYYIKRRWRRRWRRRRCWRWRAGSNRRASSGCKTKVNSFSTLRRC